MKIRTNSLGMRDQEPLAGEGPSVRRIAALGDSFTFGYWVDAEDSYPSVLERLLTESGSGVGLRYDVLNFGVGGYSTRDEAIVLRYKALRWKPELVILGYVLNDPEIDPVQPLHAYFHATQWWQHSHLLRFLAESAFSRRARRLGGGDYLRYLHADPRKWSSVETAFADIRRATKPRGIDVLVVIFPHTPKESWASYAYRDIHAKVSEAARSAGFGVLDLHDVFSEHDPVDLRISKGDNHPNAFAHQLTARAIYGRISKDYPRLLSP